MKLKLLLLILLITVLPISFASAQVNILGVKSYGLTGVGTSFSVGAKPAFVKFTGLNTPFYTDTVTGWKSYIRTIYYNINDDDVNEYAGVSFWEMNQKSLGVFAKELNWYGAFGVGVFDDPDANESILFAIKLETGLDIYKKFGLGLGIDLLPAKDKGDKLLAYFLIDYFP